MAAGPKPDGVAVEQVEAGQVAPGPGPKLSPASVAELHQAHAAELGAFLRGVLRDADLANDVVQIAFAKLVELGHSVRPESLKSWLFQVGFREALAVRRKATNRQRLQQQFGSGPGTDPETPEEVASRSENVERVRRGLSLLPAEQAEVVRLKVFEELTFAAIAEHLGIPQGTVVTRCRLAMKKLQIALADD